MVDAELSGLAVAGHGRSELLAAGPQAAAASCPRLRRPTGGGRRDRRQAPAGGCKASQFGKQYVCGALRYFFAAGFGAGGACSESNSRHGLWAW